jgi:hypothetical protein
VAFPQQHQQVRQVGEQSVDVAGIVGGAVGGGPQPGHHLRLLRVEQPRHPGTDRIQVELA